MNVHCHCFAVGCISRRVLFPLLRLLSFIFSYRSFSCNPPMPLSACSLLLLPLNFVCVFCCSVSWLKDVFCSLGKVFCVKPFNRYATPFDHRQGLAQSFTLGAVFSHLMPLQAPIFVSSLPAALVAPPSPSAPFFNDLVVLRVPRKSLRKEFTCAHLRTSTRMSQSVELKPAAAASPLPNIPGIN